MSTLTRPCGQAMNTTVPYRTPSHRNNTGKYESMTEIDQDGWIMASLKITLVWFVGMGWYYIVAFEGHKRNPDGKLVGGWTHDSDVSPSRWQKGPDVCLCAQAAEKSATDILTKHGITPPPFTPYTLGRHG